MWITINEQKKGSFKMNNLDKDDLTGMFADRTAMTDAELQEFKDKVAARFAKMKTNRLPQELSAHIIKLEIGYAEIVKRLDELAGTDGSCEARAFAVEITEVLHTIEQAHSKVTRIAFRYTGLPMARSGAR